MGDTFESKGMNEVQRLYPDVIYRFNSRFKTAWESLCKGRKDDISEDFDANVVPVFFSKSSRTFHWIGVDSSMWDWDEDLCAKSLQGLIDDLRLWNSQNVLPEKFGCAGCSHHTHLQRQDAWEDFLKDQPEGCKEAIETIRKAIKPSSNSPNWGEIHRAILTLYSGFHQNAEEHIEGVFYQFLKKCGNHGIKGRSEYLEGELDGLTPSKTLTLKEPCDELKDECGSDCVRRKCKGDNTFGVLGTDKHLISLISFRFLEYLLLHKDSGEPDSLSTKLKDKRHIALLPLYDLWIGDRGYGGIKAVFIVYFATDSFRKDWIEKKYPKLRSAFPELAEEVKESAETLAASLPITPPYDLVRHFLKVLICVQDWESAVVFEDEKFQYGYKHKKRDESSFKYSWEEGVETDFDQNVSAPFSEPVIQEQYDQSDSSKHCYMWWTAGENGTIKLWSKDFIPGFGEEEKSRFDNFSIRFEFPEATHIPSSSEDRKRLYQEYLRQQLDLMRMLIPKVRARRSALRNAAVSIMARNMSHNIGSHVLAAVRGDKDLKNEIDNVLGQACQLNANGPREKREIFENDLNDGLKQVNRLNEHLQRRMDFIAELATVEALSAADNLLFHEVLGVKDGRVDGNAGDEGLGLNAQELLLKHISGVQNNGAAVPAMITRVTDDGDEATVTGEAIISFNSGVLGWQALYVILENIIRNIAKHGQGLGNEQIKVFLKVLDNHDEFFEVRIWDECRKANKPVRDKPNTTVVEYLAETLAQPSLLDDDNAVATKDWGMKEMYISAAFLRGIALSDLEGRLLGQPAVIHACAMDGKGRVIGDSEKNESLGETTSCRGDTVHDNLGFSLWLPKAKNVAIIVDDVDKWRGSFGAQNGASEGKSKEQVEKNLKAQGVNFFHFDECVDGVRIPHRYGVWLSKDAISEVRRAELPLDLLENGGIAEELKQRLEKNEVEELIQDIRNQVIEQRLARVFPKNDFKLWMAGKIDNERCGDDLAELEESVFEKAVVFDDHGGGISERLTNDWTTEVGLDSKPFPPSRVVGKFAFYESRRSAFPQTGLFPSLLRRFAKDGFEKEALCAALTPVLILDERFQRIAAKAASSAYKGAIPDSWAENQQDFFMGNIWERMRVHVPLASDCNLEQPTLKDIKTYLEKIDMKLGKGAFVVVHQTIRERLKDDDGKNAGENLDQYLAEKANSDDWINVVCSGRGVPWQLQGKSHAAYRPRFIALSALLQCMEHMPSKLHLIRLLEVTRAPSRT